jgi:hypothetical protein
VPLTSPTGGGRSVGIVRSRTKAMEFSFLVGNVQVDIFQLCTCERPFFGPKVGHVQVDQCRNVITYFMWCEKECSVLGGHVRHFFLF